MTVKPSTVKLDILLASSMNSSTGSVEATLSPLKINSEEAGAEALNATGTMELPDNIGPDMMQAITMMDLLPHIVSI